MTTFDETKIKTEHAILATQLELKAHLILVREDVNTHAQIYAHIVMLNQLIVISKGIDVLFRTKQFNKESNDKLDQLTHKIVTLCEEYISDTLETIS